MAQSFCLFFFLRQETPSQIVVSLLCHAALEGQEWWHFGLIFNQPKNTAQSTFIWGTLWDAYIYIFSVASQMMTSTFEVETCDPYVRHTTHQGRQSPASLFDYTRNVYLLACWTLTTKYFETRSTYLSKYQKHLFHTFSTNNSEGKQR